MLDEAAAFNTSALTGESIPRTIRKGGEVLAGMISTDKVIRVEVTRPFEKSALSRILELVQNASERKAPAELFIRKFARIYTPIVTGLAALIVLLPFLYSLANAQFSFIFNDWMYRALGISGYLMPVRPRSKHSFGIFRRHRCRIPSGRYCLKAAIT